MNNIKHKIKDQEQEQSTAQLSQIKSRQLLSTIMDTIQQKSTNNNNQHLSLLQLKQSMRLFDKQLMRMYVGNNDSVHSSKENRWVSGGKEGYRSQNSNNYNNNANRSSTIVNFIKQSTNNNQHPRASSAQKYTTTSNNLNSIKHPLFPSYSTYKLQLPKPNSLTDQFLQTVLGSQQGLIEQYDRSVNPQKYECEIKQQMMQRVRNQWNNNVSTLHKQVSIFNKCEQSNPKYSYYYNKGNNSIISNHHLIGQQSGLFSGNIKGGAFFDQQHYSYLRTNMRYLAQMGQQKQRQQQRKYKNSSNNNNRKVMSEFRKGIVHNSLHNPVLNAATTNTIANIYSNNSNSNPLTAINDTNYHDGSINNIISPISSNNPAQTLSSPYNNLSKIVSKIQETGGIENTIKKMEKSLRKNQLKHLKNNQYLSKKPIYLLAASPMSPSKVQYKNSNSNASFYNNSAMINSNKQPRHQHQQLSTKFSHNYNLLSTQTNNATKKQSNTIKNENPSTITHNNRNVHIESSFSTPISSLSWRDRSKSMRNKIQQNINIIN